jgi:hypothetical protein
VGEQTWFIWLRVQPLRASFFFGGGGVGPTDLKPAAVLSGACDGLGVCVGAPRVQAIRRARHVSVVQFQHVALCCLTFL